MTTAPTNSEQAFKEIEADARELRWADQRPWKTSSHLRIEDGVVVLDLHDLNARLARRAVDRLIELAPKATTGAVVVVTGRGLHSRGKAILPRLAHERMSGAARTNGWRVYIPRAGRIALITDEAKAPSWLTEQTHPWMWLMAALILAGVLATLWSALAG